MAVLATGCALLPQTARVELEHISHPLAGWPLNRDPEDAVSQANVLLRWQHGRAYMEHGLGYIIDDSTGFRGPDLTYTGRVGVEFSLTGK